MGGRPRPRPAAPAAEVTDAAARTALGIARRSPLSRTRHLGLSLVHQLHEGVGSEADRIIEELLAHLGEGCSHCGEGAVALGLRPGQPARTPPPPVQDYGPLVAKVVATARRVLADRSRVRESPAETVRSLLALAAADRWRLVGEPGPWRRPEVVEGLLEHLRHEALEEGEDLEELARFTVTLCEQLDVGRVPPGLVHDLMAQAWAQVGQELLAREAPGAADFALRHAECLLGVGSGDPLAAVQARLVRAFWQWRLGDVSSAESELARLRALAVLVDSPAHEGELWLWSHLLLVERGQQVPAQAALHQGMDRLGSEAGALAFRRALLLQGRLGLYLGRRSGG